MTSQTGPSQRVRAYIFDMDGTITDNMQFHTKAWMQVIEELGLPKEDPQTWEHRTSGVPNRAILQDLLKLNLDETAAQYWVARKERLYREVAAGQVVEMPGFTAFVAQARQAGIRIALATGAGPENIAFNVDALGAREQFDVMLGSTDVARGKPHPDIFLAAAARLGVRPDETIVFEDAPMGLEAARRAGMRTVALRGMLTDGQIAVYPNVIRVIRDYVGLAPQALSGAC